MDRDEAESWLTGMRPSWIPNGKVHSRYTVRLMNFSSFIRTTHRNAQHYTLDTSHRLHTPHCLTYTLVTSHLLHTPHCPTYTLVTSRQLHTPHCPTYTLVTSRQLDTQHLLLHFGAAGSHRWMITLTFRETHSNWDSKTKPSQALKVSGLRTDNEILLREHGLHLFSHQSSIQEFREINLVCCVGSVQIEMEKGWCTVDTDGTL